MVPGSAYIIAARRTALGRIGGLHRTRRIEDLAAPVITACLKDTGTSPAKITHLIVGNTSETGNPARLIGLASGLPEQIAAVTIDQQCASGLAAIIDAARLVACGDAEAVIAGGAEALSMAPWCIAKPRALHQTPRFINIGAPADDRGGGDNHLEADEAMAVHLKISREQQDDFAMRAHLKAGLAADARLLPKEIVALKATAEEGRDQSATEPDLEELQDLPSLLGDGTLTAGNTSAPHDGAAFAFVVSEAFWTELGRPPALKMAQAAIVGTAGEETFQAPIVAMQRLMSKAALQASDCDAVEISETSAVQAIAFRNALGLADSCLNGDGGAIARGHPLGAAGAVLVARLFTRLVRAPDASPTRRGAVALGARGGIGAAALFTAT